MTMTFPGWWSLPLFSSFLLLFIIIFNVTCLDFHALLLKYFKGKQFNGVYSFSSS
jgi:hypothetical protein